jgi:hypothetical protein
MFRQFSRHAGFSGKFNYFAMYRGWQILPARMKKLQDIAGIPQSQ